MGCAFWKKSFIAFEWMWWWGRLTDEHTISRIIGWANDQNQAMMWACSQTQKTWHYNSSDSEYLIRTKGLNPAAKTTNSLSLSSSTDKGSNDSDPSQAATPHCSPMNSGKKMTFRVHNKSDKEKGIAYKNQSHNPLTITSLTIAA